jgi:chemosensory pili system protein ChpA (sensor histidine kinase/response regulator)
MQLGDGWLGSRADTGWAVVSARPAVVEPRRGKSKRARIGRRCALVAGADPSIRQLLRTVLEIGGLEVLEASSQAEVVGKLAGADGIPQVIVLDVSVPSFAGMQTLTFVRHDPRLIDVPVVVLTSFADPPEQARFLEQGATVVLSKPFSAQRLLDLVNQMATAN